MSGGESVDNRSACGGQVLDSSQGPQSVTLSDRQNSRSTTIIERDVRTESRPQFRTQTSWWVDSRRFDRDDTRCREALRLLQKRERGPPTHGWRTPVRNLWQETPVRRGFQATGRLRGKDSHDVTTVPSDSSPQNPSPRDGWITQLVGALYRALFLESWAPWTRIVLGAIVFVGLYLAVRTLG